MRAALARRSILPGNRIRALVVDDSVVIRRLVAHALAEDPTIEVVGAASNGAIALEKIAQCNPDVVTLDIEMPELDGLGVLRHIGNRPDRPRVIMFSTLTQRGAALTLQSLSLGADDYVTKVANVGSLDQSLASLRLELIPKIKQFFTLLPRDAGRQPAPAPVHSAAATQTPFHFTKRPGVLAIGISTGGPTALGEIIPEFPPDFPVPILIVQHMPPLFTRFLAERLQTVSQLTVEEAVHGSPVTAGKVLIAPGDYHMRVSKTGGTPRIQLTQDAPENSCRPAVDVLFRSVCEVYGAGTISAVLTGMGQDGLRGAQAMKAAGAYVIAQDEATSVVWGMPGAVVSAGLAHCVLPLKAVVPEILRHMTGV